MATPRTRGRTTARRLLGSVLATEWAIRPEWLEEFAGVALRLQAEDPSHLSAERVREEIRAALGALTDGAPMQSLAAEYGQPLDDETRATVRDGVAIIPVVGPLYHRADGIHDVCGCSSYEQIARDIGAVREARERGEVHSALFEFDSPGGEVAGVAECSDLIRSLAGEMPAHAYVANLACSAGYWLASATSRIHVARTSLLGSIGVVAAYRARGKEGVIEIVSSQSPKKRPDVRTDEGRAQVLGTLDALAEVFVDAVAEHRGVSPDVILADFGQGDVFVGQRAIDAGLADAVGSFEGVLAELAEHTPASHRGTPAAGGTISTQEAPMAGTATEPAANVQPAPQTAETLAAAHPELIAGIRTAAATAERERIFGIQGLTIAGHESLVAECAKDPAVTVEMAAVRLVQAQQAAGAAAESAEATARRRHLDALKADEDGLDAPPPSDGGEDSADADERAAAQILGAGRRPKPAA